MKYSCMVCGFYYDEVKGLITKGINPKTKWSDIPESFQCPCCGAPKSKFRNLRKDNK